MSESSPKPIVLDRDGVINEDLWGYITKKEEFKPIGTCRDQGAIAVPFLEDTALQLACKRTSA